MPRLPKSLADVTLLTAALEGLELQRRRIEEQISQVKALLGKAGGQRAERKPAAAPPKKGKKRELSAAARRRISVAQKRRWAQFRKNKKAKPAPQGS